MKKVGETFFAFQVFWMKKVCDDFFMMEQKSVIIDFFMQKFFLKICHALKSFVMQIVLWGKQIWDQKKIVMPYNCMEVISRPNVIKQRKKKNVNFGASVIILVLVLFFVKSHGTDKKHGSPALRITW